ncbi:hypothetical protein [Streptomyces bambusae]|uniref:Uncharacterized protein n=1 Tax=Streptomyces bambusae TaxID=1550616 RepID=A0ABS6Z7Q4_9ACTN|nr:hypothetical protein [Streptomyces bambusae]MBW5483791.1 hypothetical protein [Streptomyces bambusae]
MLIQSAIGGTIAGFLGAVVSQALAESIMWGCAAGVAAYASLLIAISELKDWYYNRRLMCIHEDQCAIGTLVDVPLLSLGAFGDGDMKFDLLVAPFGQNEVRDYFRDRITTPSGPFGPGPADPSVDQNLVNYVADFPEDKKNRLYITVVHQDMLSAANRASGRDFQDHYLVRDRVAMGQEAYDHSDGDTPADFPSPNPMFRADPHETLAPYLHCELEGDRFARIMDNITVALWTGLIALITICVLCTAVPLPPLLCGLLAGVGAQILAFLAWLISQLVNDPDDGIAGQEDAGIVDPAYDGDSATIYPGDSLAIHGDWIMDEEHGKYFELHPVKAVYLVCRRRGGAAPPWEVIQDLTDRRADCPYPLTAVTARDAATICRQINPAETAVVQRAIERTHAQALSVAAGLR